MKKFLLLLGAVAFTLGMNAQNLINNGTFDDIEGELGGQTEGNWGMWSDNGGVVEIVDGVAECTPGAATPDEPWHIQLEQHGAAIDSGKTYTVEFDAWADADRVLQLTLEDPANGYRQLGSSADDDAFGRSKWDVAITTEQTTYTRTTTIDSLVDNSVVKFAFLPGTTADKVYIDNVSITEVTETSVNDTEISTLNVYPNPTSDVLNIPSTIKISQVTILNVLGQSIMSIDNTVDTKIDVSFLDQGIYIIKVTDHNSNVYVTQFHKL